MNSKELYISEIIPFTIQGEGENVGRFSTFIRLSGCDMNPICRWCDTAHAHNINNGTKMTYMGIANKIRAFNKDYDKRIMRIIITGGNPCAQDLSYFTEFLRSEFSGADDDHFKIPLQICLETQGTIDFRKYDHFAPDHIVFSPKPPSAFNSNIGQDIAVISNYYKDIVDYINNNKTISRYNNIIECKIVVFTEEDLKYVDNTFNVLYNIIKGDRIVKENSFNLMNVNHYAFTIQLGTPCNAVTNTIKVQDIIHYIYSNRSSFTNELIQTIRILPQVHRILGVD